VLVCCGVDIHQKKKERLLKVTEVFILVFLDATLCRVLGGTCTSNRKSLHDSFTLNSTLIMLYQF